MSYFGFSPTILIIFAVAVLNISLGIFVYLKDPKALAHRVFLFFIFSITIWVSGLLTVFSATDSDIGIFGLRLAFVGAALIAPTFFHFSVIFPERAFFVRPWIVGAVYFMGTIFSFVSLGTDLIVRNVGLIPLGYIAEYGALHIFFGVYFIATMLLSLGLIFYKHKRASLEVKPQTILFLVGAFLTVILATTTNFIIPALTGVSFYSRFGPIAMLPFIVLTTYAIVKHHLLDVKVIATEFLIFVVVFILFTRFIVSQNLQDLTLNGVNFIAVGIFGILLIRAVYKEVKSREHVTELAGKLALSNEKLKELDALKSEFVSIASHQLRTPLTVIRGYVSMMLDGSFGKLANPVREPLVTIKVSAEELTRLVNDLLDVSRIESGHITYDMRLMSFEGIIERVIDNLKEAAGQKNVNLNFKNSLPDVGYITADQTKFYQAVLNIIDNAIKYSPVGISVDLKLKEKTENGAQKILFSCRDHGIGISPQFMSKLFTKFVRSAEAKRVQVDGMGIGLYFVKRIVEDHKGRVWAESPGVGKGSAFFIEMPRAEGK